ncbi:hypothetical protein [Rheinheimera salexigens]|uniref:Uncharacterized protein n=1 Tax=Rheinheimera salexigens TaxID=1628148 RepID=A0A1E7Q8D0_9GAMM|nr:hypothetical protein [Rheinheimera salexigens]OEY70298.1 hypothetical protein BI198_12500 [Rheinheimera salexigens]
MDSLDNFKSKISLLKCEINVLLQSKEYNVAEIINKMVIFNTLLTINAANISRSEQIRPFLITNQEWLTVTIEKLQKEQQSVANQMMQLQQRKKVEMKYSVHQ